ncbi:GumC family protein [Epilithonimonas zeae]|uniref:GumC family protein n=1 Tax=Epilithonimonas zeae TaxID=1416779 RepID=UPI00200DF9D0|nr:polysaccharide biosynthesis tyrosine autokinase [Epilithonimonas zeae]UQB68753.1 polysaccharide biosynthesis tyrosine autokinase [Epilithonimonas zeae]
MDNVKKKEEEFNLRELIKPYLKKWYWFVISIFITLVLAVVYVKFTTPLYSIKSSVLIKDAKKMSSASGDFGVLSGLGGFAGMGTNSIENELEIFKSKKLVQDVVQNLKLQISIFSKEKYHDVEIYKDTNPFNIYLVSEKKYEELPKKPVNIKIENNGKITLSSDEWEKDIITTYNKTVSLPYANIIVAKNPKFNSKKVKKMNLNEFYFTFSTLDDIVESYQKALDVDLVDKDATIIGLSMIYPNKEKAMDILNDIVRIYNDYAIVDKNTESKKTKDFIDDRISLISKELGNVENQKESFKINNDIVDIQSEARLNLQISTDAERQMLQLSTQIELANMLLNFLNDPKNRYSVLPTNIGFEPTAASAATSAINLYNGAVIERNRLLENATPENPLVIENAKKLEALRGSLKESLLRSRNAFEVTRASVSSEKSSRDIKINKVPTQEKLFRNIERQQQIKESLYLLLLQKREEAAISMAITGNKARVVDHAYALKKPVAPKKMISVLGALILGAIIPFAFIYIKELLNNKVVTKHDLDKLMDNSVLAEIPRMAKNEGHLIMQNDVSPLAEAFRILVTNIKFMLPKKDSAKVIFITSTIKGEGKTFVSVNLSLAIANSQNKVLVIGSDIRNPQLQRYNPAMKNAKGLTEFLYGEIDDAHSIIYPSEINPNCDFIYSGSIPPNPADLLQNGRYQILLDKVKHDYNYIILDTAPLMLVTDSFLISSVADATIYVTRSEVTEKTFIDFANKNVESEKIKNVGFVLNDIHKTNFGYGNKYGYGYQAEEKKWWQFFS